MDWRDGYGQFANRRNHFIRLPASLAAKRSNGPFASRVPRYFFLLAAFNSLSIALRIGPTFLEASCPRRQALIAHSDRAMRA
jgi:hypothetical protein